jgi:hypothetical protein
MALPALPGKKVLNGEILLLIQENNTEVRTMAKSRSFHQNIYYNFIFHEKGRKHSLLKFWKFYSSPFGMEREHV